MGLDMGPGVKRTNLNELTTKGAHQLLQAVDIGLEK